jgi:hypothetical protein
MELPMLNPDMRRVLTWMVENPFDHSGWEKNPDGTEVHVLSGANGSIRFSEDTSRLMADLIKFTPPNRRERIYEPTPSALLALAA